jgi:hypothetical protein
MVRHAGRRSAGLEEGGMRENAGIAVALAMAIVLFFASLAFIVALLLFVFLFVYAIVKAFAGSMAHPSPTTVLLGLVVIVATLTTAFTAGMALLGRSMTPRKRGRAEAAD